MSVEFCFQWEVDTNELDDTGQTALLYATRRGLYRPVCFLIESGADQTIADKDGKY